MNQIGRNDPCLCGSGLKYKKCCLNSEKPEPTSDDQIAYHRAQGFKQTSLEEWESAIDHFTICLESDPSQYEILRAVASCYDGLENFLLAAEFYEKALANAPDVRHFDLYYALGVSRGCAERPAKAVEAFQRCLELPGHDEQKTSIRSILELLKEIEEGKRRSNFFRVQVQLQRAFSDMEAERYESAAMRLEAISRIESEDAAIFYNLGVVYTFLNKEKAAVEYFQRSIDLNPLYAQAWYNMGQIHLIKFKDFSMARHCFERAVSIRPDYISAHHQRGVACEMLGDSAGAFQSWNRTLELDPENSLVKSSIQRLQTSLKGTS